MEKPGFFLNADILNEGVRFTPKNPDFLKFAFEKPGFFLNAVSLIKTGFMALNRGLWYRSCSYPLTNKTPKGIMRSAVPLPCFFNDVKSQGVTGQRPRQGTKSCRMERNSVRPFVCPSIHLAGPQTPPAGSQTLPDRPQTPPAGPSILSAGSQAPTAIPLTPSSWPSNPSSWPSDHTSLKGRLTGFKVQQDGSEGQLEGSESQLEGSEVQPGG